MKSKIQEAILIARCIKEECSTKRQSEQCSRIEELLEPIITAKAIDKTVKSIMDLAAQYVSPYRFHQSEFKHELIKLLSSGKEIDKADNIMSEDQQEIVKIKETVFIKKWSTHAHVLASGKITIAWTNSRMFTEEQFLQEFRGVYDEKHFIAPRLAVYEEIKKYYKSKSPETPLE